MVTCLLFAGGSVLAEPLIRREEPIEFREHEFQWSVFGLGGFGENDERVNEVRTEKTARTITENRIAYVPVTIIVGYRPRFVGGVRTIVPIFQTVLRQVVIPTRREIMETRKVRRSKEVTSIQGFGGAGIESKYFLTRNIGIGLTAELASGHTDITTLKATVTARFPMGSNAPYVYGGAGTMFDHETKAIGIVGLGLEHRLTSRSGIFADAGWLFNDDENAAVFRVGFSFIR